MRLAAVESVMDTCRSGHLSLNFFEAPFASDEQVRTELAHHMYIVPTPCHRTSQTSLKP